MPMQTRCRLLVLACVLASLLVPALASANTDPYAETRVGGLELGNSYSTMAARAVTPGTHQGYALAYDELASRFLLAARGAGKIVASNGTEITGFTRHGINRAIGDGASRAGVKPEAVLDALKNPSKIVDGVDDLGRPFQVFHGADARVVVNPQTGNIVSMNPLSGAGAAPPVP
jgi:hypothetical protein